MVEGRKHGRTGKVKTDKKRERENSGWKEIIGVLKVYVISSRKGELVYVRLI